MKKVAVFGSSGSVGSSTLDILRNNRDKFELCAIAGGSNIQKLAEQAIEFQVKNVAVASDNKYKELKALLPNHNIVVGDDGLVLLAQEKYDVAIMAISGSDAIKPLDALLGNAKIIGLANKESIVCTGSMLVDKAKALGSKIIPVDSEHSAIFQLFDVLNADLVNRVILTASGGPFYDKPIEFINTATFEQVLAHPTWKMGAKISVDSATMMNKGLELIEAKNLFNLKAEQLDVLIHPQSIVHSFVEYADGALLAQLGYPDMKMPISYALNHPKRIKIDYRKMTANDLTNMMFLAPEFEKFPLLGLAKNVLKDSMESCIVLNTLNELVVGEFLEKKIGFVQIANKILKFMDKINIEKVASLVDVLSCVKDIKIKFNELSK
ncbi:1-deoxy-D-xylulose 5-phosphate reductoisomerase [Candidatus Cyrtobacter comes]|uniref:1-deoxy-D-xylulose 5-phosphate reductoisomerase n=1 Tax=Candidatus Cyrtobacter comes TaxID=675776 RepID=A0ABU5L7R3_9RICK|nr:1-deoxy-D-xylulose-5-phosphate reductoisomerase [Candidatus Cyrtobacter comes]MDZ5762082.1 1-deoxy-D-xylulose 5-phosphate reductoisomerase [Candidatus Cyrtobacter comes]